MTPPFHIGCAIWAHKDWLGTFFPPRTPQRDLLRLYSQRLTTVEGNTTFYAIPSPETVLRWASETPPEFRFCLKIPREISHGTSLGTAIAETHAFIERVAPLGERLGPFFLQLPPTAAPDRLDDLAAWLEAFPVEYRIAVEVRHSGWYKEAAESSFSLLLEQMQAGRVIMDVRPIRDDPAPGENSYVQAGLEKKPDVPLRTLVHNGFSLVRYIGHPVLEENEPYLDEWAYRLAEWLHSGTEVYAFMHCPNERNTPELCRMLHKRLSAYADIPALPWDSQAEPPRQRSFFD